MFVSVRLLTDSVVSREEEERTRRETQAARELQVKQLEKEAAEFEARKMEAQQHEKRLEIERMQAAIEQVYWLLNRMCVSVSLCMRAELELTWSLSCIRRGLRSGVKLMQSVQRRPSDWQMQSDRTQTRPVRIERGRTLLTLMCDS